jgi:hypothetical protein
MLVPVILMYAMHGGKICLQSLTYYFHFKRDLTQCVKVYWPIYNRLGAGRYPDRNSVFGIATRYGLDGKGIESL